MPRPLNPSSRLARFSFLALIVLALALMAPGRALAARPIGIDVSDYQPVVLDWNTLKNTYGISFGWVKSSEGNSIGSGGECGKFYDPDRGGQGGRGLYGRLSFCALRSTCGHGGSSERSGYLLECSRPLHQSRRLILGAHAGRRSQLHGTDQGDYFTVG